MKTPQSAQTCGRARQKMFAYDLVWSTFVGGADVSEFGDGIMNNFFCSASSPKLRENGYFIFCFIAQLIRNVGKL